MRLKSGLVAFAAALTLGLAACGGGGGFLLRPYAGVPGRRPRRYKSTLRAACGGSQNARTHAGASAGAGAGAALDYCAMLPLLQYVPLPTTVDPLFFKQLADLKLHGGLDEKEMAFEGTFTCTAVAAPASA